MADDNPEENFEALWITFRDRYPFFELRDVDWDRQYEIYRPRVSSSTSDTELYDIFCQMLEPLNDGHVEIEAKFENEREPRCYTAERPAKFHQEFSDEGIAQLFKTTERTLQVNGFGPVEKTKAWILRVCRSERFGYIRILELEGVKKRKLTAALDRIVRDFDDLDGIIMDLSLIHI